MCQMLCKSVQYNQFLIVMNYINYIYLYIAKLCNIIIIIIKQ